MRLPSQLSAIAALLPALAITGGLSSAPLAQTADARSKQATAIAAAADFESGASGAPITASVPGSGTPWSTVSYGATPGGAIYDNTYAAHGSLAAKLTPGTGNVQAYLSWRGAFGVQTDTYGRAYLRLPAYPKSGNDNIIRGLDSVGNLSWGISLTAAGKINLLDSTLTPRASSTTSLSTSHWNRIEWHAVNSVSAGALEVRIFTNPDSTTPDDTVRFSSRDTRANTADIWFRVARTGYSIWFDDLVAGAAAYPGPASITTSTPAPTPIATPTPAPPRTPLPAPSPAGTLDVKDYGAVGSGKTDDTAAIQKALDSGGGKQVFVPAGTYRVRPLWVRTSTTLRLDSAATLLLVPGSNANLITVTASKASVVGSGTLDGNRPGQTQGAGISVGGANDVSVHDVRVVNTARSGIYAANSSNLTISGVSVSGTGYGGIFVEATAGQLSNLVIENSHVDRSSEGNSIVEGGIVVHRTGSAVGVSGVRISGNTVRMPQGPWGESVGIETLGGVKGAVIQNNTTNGAFVGISAADTASSSATGNTVSSASAYGIEVADSRQITVTDNSVVCAGYTQEGIVLDNKASTDNTISNNIVTGCVARGIALNKGSDRARIAGNQISQGAGYAIEVLSSAGVTVTNNVLDGRGTAQKALVVETSPDIIVRGNRAARFTLRGMLVYRSDRASIVNNTISQSGGDGIHLMSTTGANLTGNHADGAKTSPDALLIDTSSKVTVTGNVFSNFTHHGVLLYGATASVLDMITITQNTFSSTHAPYGTRLTGGAKLGKVVFSGNVTV